MSSKSMQKKINTLVACAILAVVSISCIIPFILLLIGSFTDNNVIINEGYSFFPSKWSAAAYEYLGKDLGTMINAYLVTIFTTAFGTLLGLIISAMLAYGLVHNNLKGSRTLNFLVLFTILFNGGLVPTYLMYTQLFHIKNTIWAQIFPSLLVNGFYVMLLRSYFRTNIPQELYEAARIDGASEGCVFFRICLPLSLPILATVGLMQGLAYWNSWLNGLYYLTDTKYYNIQNVLNRLLLDIRYLQSGFFGDMASELLATMPTDSVIMAIAVIGVIPILFIYPFFQKYYVKGITLGGVKG
ncbi:MAG: carbohydrate ABC transporter permease [Clostridiaceae bacterium]|jgi:putative aldouronate transport system permease protein|nr:carbohydrate ABC transporter permease [Clostridiaceae bacterium]